jgi:integrase
MTHPEFPEGVAVVYCEGCYGNAYGKTAHGLVRFTRRYHVAAIIDSTMAGQDAGVALDGEARDLPIVANLAAALEAIEHDGRRASHFVLGMAPDGGALDAGARGVVLGAIDAGLDVDAGLHTFLNDDEELCTAAFSAGVRLHDVRRPPARSQLHFFSGKIEAVDSSIVAVLDLDPALTLHSFRHDFATWLVNYTEPRVPLTEARAVLGHSSVTVTEIYVHRNERALRVGMAERARSIGSNLVSAPEKTSSRKAP